MPLKHWILPQADGAVAQALCQGCGVGPLLARVLAARGVATPQQAQDFLNVSGALGDPFLLRDMDKAVGVLEAAMANGDLIVIYGDYDCDGITSTVLLYRYLEEQGAQVAYYIPDREGEGYGLNREACDALRQSGAKVVLTVDNGVSANDEVAYLNTLGLKVVVTDHHQPRETLPAAAAVVNPHREDCPYPYKDLAGVGVAFKLVCALEGDLEGADTLERWADLVAIGTIADVVPLAGENRVIAAAGLRRLAESENPGLVALLAVAGLSGKALDAHSVAFGLAPRLNAASRMGCCEKSVDLMLCDSPAEAARLAAEIDGCNSTRKSLEGGIMEDIVAQLGARPALLRERVLVLAGEGWHHGIIGIVASRVVERYGRPCLLLGLEGAVARGSARSVPGFSVIDAVTACAPLLTKFGGHTMAAGFTLPAENVEEFRRQINLWAAARHPDMPLPALAIDAVLFPGEVELEKLSELSRLEPFGVGNTLPVLQLQNLTVQEIIPVGDNKHLRLRLGLQNKPLYAVYFGMTAQRFPLRVGEQVDIAGQFSVGEYMGQKRLSVRLLDIRPAGFEEGEYLKNLRRFERFERQESLPGEEARYLYPGREGCALLYRAIRAAGQVPDDADYVYLRYGRGTLTCGQVRAALAALREAGLVEAAEGLLRLRPTAGKVDLEATPVLQRLRAAGAAAAGAAAGG